jgi:hypothetical protein
MTGLYYDESSMGWVDRRHLVQYSEQWGALVNTVMNLRLPNTAEAINVTKIVLPHKANYTHKQ